MPLINQVKRTYRNLPHWQQPGSTYFLTWRVIRGRELEPDDRTIALNALRFWDDKKWFVYAAVIMPDHAHALVRPLPLDSTDVAASEFHNLSDLLHSVKRYSSYTINLRRGVRGTLWQDECYDHIIRSDREFDETWAYTLDNPVKAGFVETPELYPWLYQAGRAD